jgi:hypothetical protein
MRHRSLAGSAPHLYRHFDIDVDSIARTIATEMPAHAMPFAAPRVRLVP